MTDPTKPMTLDSYREARANAKLTKETEWMRVYEMGPKHLLYESKFLRGEVEMSADSFKARWPAMTPQERWEFVFAYATKGDFTSDDEQIVNVILQNGDDQIWSTLALFMIRHPQRSRVVAFLRERLQAKTANPFNYMQALAESKDIDAVPILRSYLDEFSAAVEGDELNDIPFSDWRNPIWRFLNCCSALWKITGIDEYSSSIRKYLHHPDPNVRSQARHALDFEDS